MKKLFPERNHISILTQFVAFILAIIYFFSPKLALAFDPTGDCGDQAIDTALGCLPVSTSGFTSALLTFLAGTAGAISLVIMLAATIQIMTGGDNAEQVKKGKELFTGAITGLLFIIFSVTLLQIIAGGIIDLPGFN
ncbi:hypothetical protein KBD75_03450 [Candidatus Woesebacteria bacterium]|nr:hypothetical protein [Candidatus Woesebacteria bacterium]